VCPGAALARTVTRIGLRALFARFGPGTLAAANDHVYENVPAFFECGPRRLSVETSVGAR
jgi:cytochrome P450